MDENDYVNRKNFHSINVQLVSDADLRITNLVAKWPGQTHDAFMLTTSALGIKFNEGQIPDGWLLGTYFTYDVHHFVQYEVNMEAIYHEEVESFPNVSGLSQKP